MSANIICRIDASAATFVKSYGSLPDEVLREAKKIIGHLLLLDNGIILTPMSLAELDQYYQNDIRQWETFIRDFKGKME